MRKLFLLLLFSQLSSTVKHSLKYFCTVSSGLPDFPEFVVAAAVDDILMGYCDSNSKRVEPQQHWVKVLFDNEPQELEWYRGECLEIQPKYLKTMISSLKQRFNHTGGVHILQRMSGCEWDDETGEVRGFNQYGYDGEDFMAFDLKTYSWITTKPQALTIKLQWDADKARMKENEIYHVQIFPVWLRKYLDYGKSSLLRTDLPSVSLLQKTPSSPVRCFATGFYPKTASLFWTRDGVEIHEDVEHGEILPNQDGTFQMSVDLDVSSVKAEDWGRLDCVFQLSGVKEDMVTRLEKDQIRTNWEFSVVVVIGPVLAALLLLLTLAVAGLLIWRRNSHGFRPANTEDSPASSSDEDLAAK